MFKKDKRMVFTNNWDRFGHFDPGLLVAYSCPRSAHRSCRMPGKMPQVKPLKSGALKILKPPGASSKATPTRVANGVEDELAEDDTFEVRDA